MPPRIREFVFRHVVERLRGSYARALEQKIARLRAENRGLVNSILGLAGIPPMSVAAGSQTKCGAAGHLNVERKEASRQPETIRPAGRELQANSRRATAGAEGATQEVRRRSWQQIGRAREIEDALAARRERESDADAFPAPRNIVPRV